MISRRAPRPSKATERLQQLCLNNSAGVDVTRAHNDVKSTRFLKNFVINTDGSISLRKPIVLRTKFLKNITKVIPLFNGAYLIVGSFGDVNGCLIVGDSLESVSFRIVWNDMYGNERVHVVPEDTPIPSDTLDLSNAIDVQTGTGTILSNVQMSRRAKEFPGKPVGKTEYEYFDVFDKELYDNTYAVKSSRLVQVYYDNFWVMRIHIPEPNVYRSVNGKYAQDFDNLLDNPFATRDSYNVAVPTVRNIRAYAYTTKQSEGIKLADDLQYFTYTDTRKATPAQYYGGYFQESESESQNGNSLYRKFYFSKSSTDSKVIAYTGNVEILLNYEFDSYYILRKDTSDGDYLKTVVTDQLSTQVKCTLSARKNRNSADITSRSNFSITIPAQTLTFTLDHKVFSYDDAGDWISLGALSSKIALPKLTVTADTFGDNFDSDMELCTCTEFVNGDLYSENKDYLLSCFNSGSEAHVTLTMSNADTFATVFYDYKTAEVPNDVRVTDLTESTKSTRFRAMTLSDFSKCNIVVLKAFLGIPTDDFETTYCSWRYTLDGITWNDALSGYKDAYAVEETSTSPIDGVDTTIGNRSDTFNYVSLNASDAFDTVESRGDCLILTKETDVTDGAWSASAFMFKLCTLNTNDDDKTATVKGTYGVRLFYETIGTALEFEDTDLGCSAVSAPLYSKSRLFSYGNPSLKNCIFYTYPNELVMPITNVIELGASADSNVTVVVRWRNSIVSATEQALYLSEQQDDAFYTKVLNTALGIPLGDARCCVPILNGVLFKSGAKVYQLYPNVYSDDGTVLNVTDISQSIAHYLEAWHGTSREVPFAFSTESEYVLMLPQDASTLCLRYDYVKRVWTAHEYAVKLQNVRVESLDNIRLWGVYQTDGTDSTICEYLFDTNLSELPFSDAHLEHVQYLPYGDVYNISATPASGAYGTLPKDVVSEIVSMFHTPANVSCITPIQFEVDTGQKTDTIFTTKQFVESKLVFATEHGDDAFPMQLTVHIDGDPHIVTKDISTDASFWKGDGVSGVLNTTFNGLSSTSDSFNTLRQLVVRYSGKGKSIRHILTGKSLCNFKLYETYIRYKLLNVKQ